MDCKECKFCGETKPIDEFAKDKTVISGRRTSCKECLRISLNTYQREYRRNNLEKARERDKKHRDKNKKRIGQSQRKYYQSNKKRIDGMEWRKKSAREYYKKNRDVLCQKARDRRQTQDYKDKFNKYCKERLKNPIHKLTHSIRVRVGQTIRGERKTFRGVELIGCDFNFLKSHLEQQFIEGMSWENYGFYGWHIDHIKPCDSFDLSKESEQKKCFHYTNLQPLWHFDNFSKNRYHNNSKYEAKTNSKYILCKTNKE